MKRTVTGMLRNVLQEAGTMPASGRGFRIFSTASTKQAHVIEGWLIARNSAGWRSLCSNAEWQSGATDADYHPRGL